MGPVTGKQHRKAHSQHWSGGRLLGAAALALGAFQVARFAVRARQELREHATSNAQLGTNLTTIKSPASGRDLQLHARSRAPQTLLPPVVLVHGYGVGSSYMVPLAARLSHECCVWVPDLPGHGLSPHDDSPLSIPQMAATLAAWLDAANIHSPILVGHSLGCQVVAEVAAARPDHVAGLVLIGPTSDPEARTIPRQVARALASSTFERPTYTVWTSADYRRAGRAVLIAEMREMIRHRIEDVLPQLNLPVRVVRGARDRLVPQKWAETVARLAKAPDPVSIPGWGHAVHYDAPQSVADVVLDLARSVPLNVAESPSEKVHTLM